MNHKSIIFIPGYNFKSSIWSCMLPYLKDFQVRLLDFPEVRIFTLKDIIEKLAHKIPDDSIIVGWSLGGLIAIYLYKIMPKKCRKLVLVSSTPRFMEDINWPGHSFDQMKASLNIFNQIVQYPNKSIKVRQYLKEHTKTTHENYLLLIKNLDGRNIYTNISVPTLNILGDSDAIIPIKQLVYFSKFHKTIIIPKAGHIPFLTHTNIFVGELIKFIKS